MELYKLAYDRIPDYDTRSEETVRNIKEGAPWLRMEEDEATKRTVMRADTPERPSDIINIYRE